MHTYGNYNQPIVNYDLYSKISYDYSYLNNLATYLSLGIDKLDIIQDYNTLDHTDYITHHPANQVIKSYTDNMRVALQVQTTNSQACTLSIDNNFGKPIVRSDGNALIRNDLRTDTLNMLEYRQDIDSFMLAVPHLQYGEDIYIYLLNAYIHACSVFESVTGIQITNSLYNIYFNSFPVYNYNQKWYNDFPYSINNINPLYIGKTILQKIIKCSYYDIDHTLQDLAIDTITYAQHSNNTYVYFNDISSVTSLYQGNNVINLNISMNSNDLSNNNFNNLNINIQQAIKLITLKYYNEVNGCGCDNNAIVNIIASQGIAYL